MDESAVLDQLKAGSHGAIEELMEQYKGPLFAFIIRMTGDYTAAEDIFQETWLRVVRSSKSFRGDSKISTWLFQIALNLCRDALRKKKSRRMVPIEDVVETLGCEPDVDPDKLMRAQRVREMVEELNPKMREVVVLKFFHDLADDEIAKIIGCPVGTVKSRFYRASELLRKKWTSTA